MKKYVSKEDVEKGLVDPKKPLTQQKQYLDKIEKQDKEKNPNKDKKEHVNKRERENRPKYNWNRRDVNENTPIPDAPKKEVPRPDKDKFHQQLNALKKQIDVLNEKKSGLINDLKFTLKNTSENKKNTQMVRTKYSSILRQKFNTKKVLEEELKILDEKKEQIQKEMNELRSKIGSFRKPQNFQDCSVEQLKSRLEKTEHRLTTADLDKKQQNRINMKILQIKRAIPKARTQIQINAQVSKLQDNNSIVFQQQKQIKSEIHKKYTQLKQLKAEIGKIKQQQSSQKAQPEDTRTHDEIKTDFDTKIEQVNKEKNAIKQKIEKLRENYNKQLDDYEDYSDLMAYIKMIKQEKQKIKQWKDQQQRRKKQKEEREKQKQKQFQERQKRRKQRQQRQQQRKKQSEQRKQKLKKQREDYINRNPHQDKIDTCKHLIDYCESLKPENAQNKVERREEKNLQQITQLKPADSKDWQKQLKKGAQVIVSKKLKQDEEVPKKVPKEKKKKQKQTAEGTPIFTHYIETSKMFESINMLPPLTAAEIDETIKQINERVELYSKPTEEQVNNYKAKAGKQFDTMHGIDEDRGRKGGQYVEKHEQNHQHKEKQSEHKDKEEGREKEKHKKAQKKQIKATEQDFPGLN